MKISFKKECIAPLLSMTMILLLIAVSAFVMFDHTVAWFAVIDEVGGEGMQLEAGGQPETEQYLMIDGVRVEEHATDLFAGLKPGDRVTFQLYVKNKSAQNVVFQLFMDAPTEDDDQPYVLDGQYHYMGSQLRILSLEEGGEDLLRLTGNDRYLLTLDDALYIGSDASLPPTAIDAAYDFSSATNKTLTDTMLLADGEERIFTFELEFVDNGISQNPYIDYGSADAKDPAKRDLSLSRTLVCYFEYEE